MTASARHHFASLLASFVACTLSAGCGGGPGGIACAVLRPVESVNRSPLVDVVGTIITAGARSAPIYSFGRPEIELTGACSGTTEIELTHPNYQTMTVRYTSPRDRSLSGNTFTDYVTVVMTAR
jgi:hypothetical protein